MSFQVWREITAAYNGKIIKGSFKFIDGMVAVRTQRGSKTTQLRGYTPEQMAKNLLRELAREEGVKGLTQPSAPRGGLEEVRGAHENLSRLQQ
jgi:hypothetical protein